MTLRASPMRKGVYKKGINAEFGRRKREENLVQIRKNKKDDCLFRKRRGGVLLCTQPMLEALPQMVQAVFSNDFESQLEGASLLRKLLSTDDSLPIQEVIDVGVVPRLVEFLHDRHPPELQFEAAWALTNIASSSKSAHIDTIVRLGAIAKLTLLLDSTFSDIRDQAVWALGNIAGDTASHRDLCLDAGALMSLLAQLDGDPKLAVIRNTTWALSNLCRGKPPVQLEKVKPLLPYFRKLIDLDDEEVMIDICLALSFISEGTNENIQAVMEAGFVPRLLQLLNHPSCGVLVPTLQALGNIVSGDDAQTQFVIDNGGLPCLYRLITKSPVKQVKKEACWMVSNITGGNQSQIQAVIDANIIPPLVSLLQHTDRNIRNESAWAISNAATGGSAVQIQYIVSQGCIKPLCDLLVHTDAKTVMVCLEAIEAVLQSGKAQKKAGISNVNIYQGVFYECEGLEKIEELQCHRNNEIYKKVVKILDRYWIKEEDTDSETEIETETKATVANAITANATTAVANIDAPIDINTQLDLRRLSLT